MIQIYVNGQMRNDMLRNMSVLDLITKLQIPLNKIAIERNLKIVPKSTLSSVKLAEGDRFEIIHFIGGG